MTEHSERWQPVADAVRARMRVLGMHRKADLYRAAGLSEPTVRPLITAELRDRQEPTEATCQQVAVALRWSPDSINRLLAGKKPVEVEAPPAATDVVTRSEFEALAAEVAGLQREILAAQEVTRSRVPLYDRLLDVEWPELVERVEQLEAGGDGRRANAGL